MSSRWLRREAEFAAVQNLLVRARTQPAGLVVSGEPGIGKTSLCWWASETASDAGFTVLAARGAATEVTFAYAAVADLLASIGAAVLDDLPALQRDALQRILVGSGEGTVIDDGVVRAACVAVLRRLQADAPLLVLIDDAQWLDSSSRAILAFAARRLTGRTAMLATVRSGETGESEGLPWLALPRPDALDRVRMGPLTLGGVHALVAARLGSALPRPVITGIYEIAGGNPFFALELAQSLHGDSKRTLVDLPESLAALVRERIGTLSEKGATVLLAAASATTPTVELLAGATAASPTDVLETLEILEARGIVELHGNRVRFSHPLFATGAYSAADPARRRRMHRALASVVEQPELKARHLGLAATTADTSTLEALDAAAEATRAQGAPAAAAELFELAISLGGDDPVRRLRAAEQHFRAGTLPQARIRLDSVLDEVPSGTLRCVGLMLLAALEGYGDNLRAAVQALATAVDEATEPALRLQALLLLTPAEGLLGDMAKCVDHARNAVALAEAVGIEALRSQALAIWVDVSFLYGLGADDTALAVALDHEPADSDAAVSFQATAVAAVIAGWKGDLIRARAEMAEVQRRSSERGTEIDILWAAGHAVSFDVWLSRYAEASDTAQELLQRAEQMGGSHPRITALSAVAAVTSYTGSPDDARAAAREAVDAAHRLGAEFMTIAPLSSSAFVETSLGRYAETIAVLGPLLDTFDSVHGTEMWVGGWLPDAIEALCALGRVDEAEPLVTALETNGIRFDRAWMLAVGARGRALCLAARGDLAAAQRSVEVALTEHDRLPMPFEKARTQLLAGQLLRRLRQRQRAVTKVAEALQAFEALGTPAWILRARAELDRLDTRDTAGGGLTTGEQRIAEHAAAGLSNKQIAAEMYLSEKTVEANLSKVYRKLGIRSRAALASRLGAAKTRETPGS